MDQAQVPALQGATWEQSAAGGGEASEAEMGCNHVQAWQSYPFGERNSKNRDAIVFSRPRPQMCKDIYAGASNSPKGF